MASTMPVKCQGSMLCWIAVSLLLFQVATATNGYLHPRRGGQKAADPVYRSIRREVQYGITHRKVSAFGESEVPDARPPPDQRLFNSSTVERVILEVGDLIKDDTIRQIFANCLPSTLDTTVLFHRNVSSSPNGIPYTYIITGDIPAMWIRDSTYQINPYVPLARHDPILRQMAVGVINTQAEMLNLHAYANAFLPIKHWESGIPLPPSDGSSTDQVHPSYDNTEVWEAKYELDSLASFLYLSKYFYESTDDLSFTQNPNWIKAVDTTVKAMRKLQGGTIEVLGREPYSFTRVTRTQSETQNLYGKGNPVKRCGLIRSFFRPSDDSTIFQYLIPANALAVTGLEGVANILLTAGIQYDLAGELIAVATEIRAGIQKHGIVQHPQFGRVYAYEVDCYGSHLFMDDANFPSVLSMAKFGFVPKDDPIYLNSRKYILSSEWNPYYADGKFPGVGSPHTGLQKPWHMALAMQAMTSTDEEEILRMLNALRNSTAGTGFMHESYNVDNPNAYTRPWFAWANTVFGDLILHLAAEKPHLLAGEPPRKNPSSHHHHKYQQH